MFQSLTLPYRIEEALPWMETIQEKAEAEKIDPITAAVQIAQELRRHRQFGGLEKQIERASQELALVDMATMQKQQALKVLIDLLNRGVTESQILQLINFTNEWDKHWGANNKSNVFGLPQNTSTVGWNGSSNLINGASKSYTIWRNSLLVLEITLTYSNCKRL